MLIAGLITWGIVATIAAVGYARKARKYQWIMTRQDAVLRTLDAALSDRDDTIERLRVKLWAKEETTR